MNFKADIKVGAIFKCIVRKVETDEITKESGEFKNVVLLAGIERMNGGQWGDYMKVGSGDSPPNENQTALESQVAQSNALAAGTSATAGIQNTVEPAYWFGRKTYRFAVGTATGNLAEVGLGWVSGLWNRALIRGEDGQPATITVLPDEYLDVVCEVRFYPTLSSGSFNIVDKQGAVISTHTYKATVNFPTTSLSWDTGGLALASTGFSTGFTVYTTPITEDHTTLPSTAIYRKNGGSITKTASGKKALVTIPLTSSEANGTNRSFLLMFKGVMSTSSNNNDNAHLSYKWEINPPIEKTINDIYTHNISISWSNL